MKATRTVANDLTALVATLDWLEATLRAAGVGGTVAGEMRLVAEEGLSNVIRHGCADSARHTIEVAVEIGGGEIRLTLRDDGRPFDPLAAPTPDPDPPSEARRPGGFGIPLLRGLVDRADYRREGETNVLSLVKRSE